VVLLLACGEDEQARTREEFCQDWAAAVCSDEVLSACQAANEEACHQSQENFCRTLVPEDFSDAHGDACIDAVGDAYADADLRDEELATVLALGGPCDRLFVGPKSEGEACDSPRDCDVAAGYDCVMKSNAARGRCEVPETVGAGRDCSAPQKTCSEGFYCDGGHCVEGKSEGDACTIQDECGRLAFCNAAGECAARLEVSEPCGNDFECATGICHEFEGKPICTDRVILARSEPLCADLR
jgi:hypothetical protein